MKVLVAGATGLLGSHLVPYLKEHGYTVFGQSNARKSDFNFNLTSRETTKNFLDLVRPDIIVNLVSLTSVEMCEGHPHQAYLLNTKVVENLCDWINQKRNKCHLVQVSTDHVYDGDGFNKEDQISITNTYALTKRAGEIAACQTASTILRTNFVGRSNVSHRESLTDWVFNSIREEKEFRVLDDVHFNPLSIQKLAEMIALVIERKPIGIFNLGSKTGMSKADFDFAFAEYLNLPTSKMLRIGLNDASFLKARRPKNMVMDCSKFESTMEFKLPSLEELIPIIAEEYREKS